MAHIVDRDCRHAAGAKVSLFAHQKVGRGISKSTNVLEHRTDRHSATHRRAGTSAPLDSVSRL